MPEILITVLIISFGLLALAGMQTYAVAVNKLAGNRAVAAIMANDLIEVLQANNTAYRSGRYDRAANFNNATRTVDAFTTPACITDVVTGCPADVLADYDNKMFAARLKAALPAGDYRLVRDTAIPPQWTDIWILWAEQITTYNQANQNEGTTDKVNDNCPPSMQPDTGATNSALRGLRCFYMRIPL